MIFFFFRKVVITMRKKFFLYKKKKKKKLCNILWFYNEIAVYIFIQAYSVLVFFRKSGYYNEKNVFYRQIRKIM